MDIKIPNNWLKDFLKTDASPKKIAEYLSLCGPTIEKIEKVGKTHVYHAEITTNRVDSVSVHGIAREAAAILPRFGIKARFLPLKLKSKQTFSNNVKYLDAEVNRVLCPRFTAVLIKDVKIKTSPSWMKEKLLAVGVRPINNVVDISNFIMHELGQPVHTFDYNKIKKGKMILRSSKRGEKLTTLDGKTHTLKGGDIVIEDGEGRLIDLAGIMGGENSAVEQKTKNILLFIQTYNPVNIRKTSIALAQRTEAAVLFEKGLDTQLVTSAMRRGIDLFVQSTGGKPEKKILDIYPKPYKVKSLKINLEIIENKLGISISKIEISKILINLGFETSWQENNLKVDIPSFRANDINIAEDIVEEIARIYGYHNLPSQLMKGVIPNSLHDSPFEFEFKLKNILKSYGGHEIYTLSLVPQKFADKKALKLKNPLGSETAYLRTSLMPSLVATTKENSGEKDPYHLFEIANVYLPIKGKLPNEKMTLAGIFVNEKYREAKGIIESLLDELNIKYSLIVEDAKNFLASRHLFIKSKGLIIGRLGIINENYIYYEFDIEALRQVYIQTPAYQPSPKYPSQIEDITLKLPDRTRVGDLVNTMKSSNKYIKKVELTTIYKDSYTFRVWYQHPKKTLTDQEVEKIRNNLISIIKKKFGVQVKI